MRLTALVESTHHVCCRYRLEAFRPLLELAGHRLTAVSLPRGWWGRIRLFRALTGADVVLQRKLLPGWQLATLRRSARTLLFDFDDAVFLRDSYSPRGTGHAGRLRRFTATVRSCDAAIAGNAFLAGHAARSTEGRRVHVIPTCVDPTCYPLREPAPGPGTDLVWVGSSSTLKGIERSATLWEELGSRIPGLRLKLVCDRFLTFQYLPVLPCPWSESGEADAIAAADIGVSWMPDDDWSRGKCGLKVLQYMAAGLPVVANPAGVHSEMVRHGETGYLATTADEWVAAVGLLARDPGLRRRMGRAGRRLVEGRYSVAAGAELWRKLLDGLERGLARAA